MDGIKERDDENNDYDDFCEKEPSKILKSETFKITKKPDQKPEK